MKIRAMLAGLAVASWVSAAAQAGAEVQIKIENGAVWLTATSATVGEILAEWARVGQTRIVNGEKVPGGPVTLQLTNEPEERALDTILRAASGYMAAPRPTVIANASRYDRIVVLPTSSPPRNTPPAQTPPFQPPQPAFAPPQFPPGISVPGSADDDDQDGVPPPRAVMPNPRNPVFNGIPQLPPEIFQQQQQLQQQLQQQAAPAPAPQQPAFGAPGRGGPVGVPVPGMIVQPPAQPGQGQTAAPQQPDQR
jgi:hypothetical protein